MKKWLLIVFASLSIMGCSSKLAYDNLDWLIYWYMDDYVELSDHQEDRFDAYLARWIDWHRSKELPAYQEQLQQLRAHIKNDALDKQTIAYHLEQARQHVETLRVKLAPDLAELASELTDEQVIYLFAALEKENREEEEEILERRDKSAAELKEDLIEQVEEEFEDRMGDLTDTQERIIGRYAPQFQRSGLLWIEYRRAIQNAARRLFIQRDDKARFVDKMTRLMMEPDAYRSQEYLALRESNRALSLELTTELVQTLNADQKAHLLDKVDNWLETIEDLR